MKRLLSVALMVLVILVGMVGFSRAGDAVSALQASANATNEAVGTVQSTANDGFPARARMYYLTSNSFDGGEAIMACDSGFHMASISEMQDPSNLQYDNRSTTANAPLGEGQSLGPPLNQMGWVRSAVYPPTGLVYDCVFRDKDAIQLGITLALYDYDFPPLNSGAAQPASYPTKGWYTTQDICSRPEPVWCVEDPA